MQENQSLWRRLGLAAALLAACSGSALAAPVVSTLAGKAGSPGEKDGQGSAARFMALGVVGVDAKGNVYVQDQGGGTTRVVSPGGLVTTIALNSAGNGPVLTADAAGNVYFMGRDHVIYKRLPSGKVNKVAGVPYDGGNCYDGPKDQAQFSAVAAMVVGPDGSIYLTESDVSDVRKILPDGTVTTLAGSCTNPGSSNGQGTNAQFSGPEGIGLDPAGNVLVADSGNNMIRRITPGGQVSTLVTLPYSVNPYSLAVDAAGYIYLPATPGVLKFSPGGASIPFVQPVPGYTTFCQDGAANAATFGNPQGVVVDASYNVYIADALCSSIRKITQTVPVVTGLSLASGIGAGSSITIKGSGFDPVAVNNTVTFAGGVTVTPAFATANSLTLVVPIGALSGTLSVASDGVPATGTASLQLINLAMAVPVPQAAGLSISAAISNAGNATFAGAGFCYGIMGQSAQTNSCVTATVKNGVLSTVIPTRLTPGQNYFLQPSLTLGTGETVYGTQVNYTPPQLAGVLMGGVQPVAGSSVTVYAASQTPGAPPVQIGSAITDANGGFVLGNFQAPFVNGQLIYALASGGNPGAGVNTAATFMTVAGVYGSGMPGYLTINELTTVAAGYQLQGILQTQPCLKNPQANCPVIMGAPNLGTTTSLASLVNVSTGQVNASLSSAAQGTPAYSTYLYLNTLASILAACVESGSEKSPGCQSLFTMTGATDTLGAASKIAANPAANAGALYQLLSTTRAFAPTLGSAPPNWSLSGQLFMNTPSLNTCYAGLSGSGSVTMPAGTIGFVYGSNPSPTIGAGDARTAVVTSVSGSNYAGYILRNQLPLNQNLNVRAYAQNGSTVTYSSAVSFSSGNNYPDLRTNCTTVLTQLASLPGTRQYYGLTSWHGNIYASSATDHTITELSPPPYGSAPGTPWVQKVIAGATGSSGFADGNGAQARFNSPQGIAVDTSGNLYVADSYNNRIRKLVPQASSWTVSTIAGSGLRSQFFSTGGNPPVYQDGPALEVQFYNPGGVAVDAKGNVYIADTGDNVIRVLGAGTGKVTTIAGDANYGYVIPGKPGKNGFPGYTGYATWSGNRDGSNLATAFCSPQGIRLDSAGNLYVADNCNNAIRQLSPDRRGGWEVTTASLANAGIYKPEDVAVYEPGNGAVDLYVANHDRCPGNQGICGNSIRNQYGQVLVGDPEKNTLQLMPPASLQPVNAVHIMANVLLIQSYNTLVSAPISEIPQQPLK